MIARTRIVTTEEVDKILMALPVAGADVTIKFTREYPDDQTPEHLVVEGKYITKISNKQSMLKYTYGHLYFEQL